MADGTTELVLRITAEIRHVCDALYLVGDGTGKSVPVLYTPDLP